VLTRDQLRAVIDNKPKNFGEQPDTFHSDAIFFIDLGSDIALLVFSPREGIDKILPGEVFMARSAGANAITVLGNAPLETLNLFINECRRLGMISMIDMIGVKDPLDTMRLLKNPSDVVVLHLGRDEETTRGKPIQYRRVNRINSKYPTLISAVGGGDVREARSAIFDGANIVVVNVVLADGRLKGISTDEDIGLMARKFLETIE